MKACTSGYLANRPSVTEDASDAELMQTFSNLLQDETPVAGTTVVPQLCWRGFFFVRHFRRVHTRLLDTSTLHGESNVPWRALMD